MRFSLAVRNLLKARTRFAVSALGIAFASFLMAVQCGLLYGFTMAASRMVDAIDADLWLVPKGIPAFDFMTTVPRRYADLALAAPGAKDTGLGAAAWVPFTRPGGAQTIVFLVGIETAFRGRAPDVAAAAAAEGVSDGGILVDVTDAAVLGLHAGRPAEARGVRATGVGLAHGFASFLGTPLVFASHPDARNFMSMPADRVGFVVVRLEPGADTVLARDWLRNRLPDVDVWTKTELSWRSRVFWLVQTGAGGALTLAALLGFAIGLIVAAQTVYSLTMESLEEYATLRAMGASDRYVRSVVQHQAMICGLSGGAVGLALVAPFSNLARRLVTWIEVPSAVYAGVAAALFVLCTLAARVGVRPALTIDPGRVFRA